MFSSLLTDLRNWHLTWRRRRAVHRLMCDRGSLGFLAMLGVPFVALTCIVYVAATGKPQLAPPRVDAARRRAIDLQCLAENVYFEARGEPLSGQYAVADVTLNRVRSPLFPATVCEVVHEARWDPGRRRFVAHFSWTELERRATPVGPAWKQAMAVASAAYDSAYSTEVPDALYYHATTAHPYWARAKRAVAKIGNHVFYR